MKVKLKNLLSQYPRSPRDTLGEYVHSPRMIDKIRSKNAGTLGLYIYPCPMGQSLLGFLGLSEGRFFHAVTKRDDKEILHYLLNSNKLLQNHF